MNQKTKIFTTGLVLIFGAVLFLGAGCTLKPSIFTGQLTTEDKCVELMAHGLMAYQYGQDMAALEAWQQKIDNLKNQYGWSDEDITNNCQKFSQQTDFMARVGKRMQELTGK